MELQRIISEDDAVSPVIGVILMVAITVILAAVIASFVLGLGDEVQTTPTASISFDYTNVTSGSGTNTLDITHDGGDSIKGTELYIRGDGFDGDTSTDPINISSNSQWDQGGGDMSGKVGDTDAVVAGDNIIAGVTSEYNIRAVWEATEGDSSATLARDTGPDA